MMRLRERGRMMGEQASEAARDRIARRAADALPGVSARVEEDKVVLMGRGLAARVMREPMLRWIGSLVR